MSDKHFSSIPLASDSGMVPMLKIFESQPGLILILSPDLSIQAVTNAYLEELEMNREDILGKNLFDLFPQNPGTPEVNSVAKLKGSLNYVVSHRQKHEIEIIHYDVPSKADPTKFLERYWNTINTPVPDEQGEVAFIIHETRNITAKIKAERKARESQSREQAALARVEHERARLERYFLQAPAQISICSGPEFVFEFVNPAYQENLFPGRKLLGRPLAEAVPEIVGQPIAEVLRQVYETGETIEGKEVCIPLAPAEGAPVQDHYFNYIQQARLNENGEIDGIMTFAYDVTELVEARQKLQAVNADLEEKIFARTSELEQARTEAELQKDRLNFLFMQAPVATCVLTGPDMVYEMVNPAYQALFPGRRLKGRPLQQAIPEIFDSEVGQQIQYVYKTGNSFEAKEALIPVARNEEGPVEEVYFNYIIEPNYRQGKEIDGVLVFAYDVTEQVLARRNAEMKEEILEFALKAGRMATFDLDLQTNKTIRSANHDQLFGYEANLSEWNMEALLDHMLAEDHEVVLKQFERSIETGELLLNPRIRQKDGTLRYIEGYGKVFYEEAEKEGQRKALRIAGVVADVTERKLSQQQKEKLAAIVENSSDLIGLYTPCGAGIYFNQAGKFMLGLPEGGAPDKVQLANLFSPEDQELLRETILPALRKNGNWQGETSFRNIESNTVVPVHYTAFSIEDPASGDLLNLAIIMSDITALKKKEEQLQALSRQLAAANKGLLAANENLEGANQQLTHINVDLDNFIYAASHDLKAPITNIEGLVRLLNIKLPKDVLAQEQIKQIIRMMQDSIGRFQKTIGNLTDITRLQKDNSKEEVLVNLQQVVEEVNLDLAPMIKEANVRVEVQLKDCPAFSFAEKNIRSIVYNLVSNAIKYRSPERKPVVNIRCRQEADFVVLEVQDNGLGLKESNEKKLFSMFKRFHSHVEGSGIGLYMVKKIVENARGKIQVQSKLGEGSTFSVFFRR